MPYPDNVPNNSNTYLPISPVIPMALLITNMTNAQQMVVTVMLGAGQVNSYVIGQLVHLTIPSSYGMPEANQLTGQILAIDGLNFTLNINSTQFGAFVIPSTYQEQPASLSPAGSRNLYNYQEVPFHSKGNFGN